MVIYMLESSNECWFKMTLGSLWLVSQKKPKRDPLGSGLESLGLSWLVAAGWKHVSCVGNCLNHICNHVISCINVIMYICDYVYIYIILFYSWIYEFISWTSFLAVIYHMNYVCMSIICICICICIYIYTYICMWIYIYVYIYIYAYMYIYIYIHIYIYRYTNILYIYIHGISLFESDASTAEGSTAHSVCVKAFGPQGVWDFPAATGASSCDVSF